jgi:prophage antirepressor-like protein
MVGWAGVRKDAGIRLGRYANSVQFTTSNWRCGGDNSTKREYHMNTKPSVFKFESDSAIRAIIIDGNPWFFAADVCRAIGVVNHRDAVRKLDDEKGVGSTDTLGGEQESVIISESGLYTLILRCRDAVTPGTIPYRFRKWVTYEVLPQIRRTGRYVREELSPADKAQKVVASFMPAILEAMKSEEKQEYNYPLKPGYRDHIHSPEGVVGLTEHSLLMNLLNKMHEDGHDVSGAAAEFTTMVNYIVGVTQCLSEIRSHAQYISTNAAKF